ncbi:ubiquitin carboxyl-terminal hydrolase 18 [Micractinium conductrix]|uniref:Ubiquitin carboxyl-terminal hydrolase 18 n=1 Tax=Micractinium conductrix TaxID=554055 RepID=A0A2P6V5C2_9CHLO|nr:ubiquitin carboxyl-terminal hydrolase 18 [Micractinium conductrix]|eukprot:PSC69288.1 ubiquitin carboxyl-terminal hydrolase 18 [Micractinium conductrix]
MRLPEIELYVFFAWVEEHPEQFLGVLVLMVIFVGIPVYEAIQRRFGGGTVPELAFDAAAPAPSTHLHESTAAAAPGPSYRRFRLHYPAGTRHWVLRPEPSREAVPTDSLAHGAIILAAPCATAPEFLQLAGGGYVKRQDEGFLRKYGREALSFGWVEEEAQRGQAPLPRAPDAVPDARAACAACGLARTQAAAADRHLKHCSRCQAIWYCCAVCQEAHWRASHRWVCKEALPPAEAAPAEVAPDARAVVPAGEEPSKDQPAKKED